MCLPTCQDGVKNRDKAFYSKLSHTLPHVIPGGVLWISSDGDDRRIFWGFEIFDSGKFGTYFFGWLGVHASRDFSKYLKQTEDSWLYPCIPLQTQTFNS